MVNKFRGDPALLAPGLTQLQELTGRPTYGVIPFDDGFWLDTEDSVSVQAHRVGRPAAAAASASNGCGWRRSGCPASPTPPIVEALACEPGVLVRWVTDPADLADADVVVIPGSKATVADLDWLRERGLADGIVAHARSGRPVLGICGGFQMLCRRIDDPVESGAGGVDGLGLLDADIVFAPDKTLRHWRRSAARLRDPPRPGARDPPTTTGSGVGIRTRRAVYGTHWHGLLDNDDFRRRWLADAAAAAGRHGFAVADDVDVSARRDAQLDLMADLLAAHARRRRDPRPAGERTTAAAGDRQRRCVGSLETHDQAAGGGVCAGSSRRRGVRRLREHRRRDGDLAGRQAGARPC